MVDLTNLNNLYELSATYYPKKSQRLFGGSSLLCVHNHNSENLSVTDSVIHVIHQ